MRIMKITSKEILQTLFKKKCAAIGKESSGLGVKALPETLSRFRLSYRSNSLLAHTHSPLRCWGVTIRINVWYHDKNYFGELTKPATNA